MATLTLKERLAMEICFLGFFSADQQGCEEVSNSSAWPSKRPLTWTRSLTDTMGTLSQRELEDYLNEFRDYLDSNENITEDETSSAAEESEQDAEWLREAGFEFLVDCFKDEKDENDLCDGIMATLTHQQAATVRRRYEQFKATAGRRRRCAKSRPPDVRDVFAHGNENNVLPPSIPEELPLSKSPVSSSDTSRQNSVEESRTVFKTDSLAEESKHKSHWREHFLRSGYKQGYKLTHLFNSDPKSETGVEVLSYQVRSSMKGLTTKPRHHERQRSLGSLPPTEELEEDLVEQEYEFELDGRPPSNQDELPEVKMIPNQLGITYPSDVSQEDLRKIHPLALIEVTALLDKQQTK